MIRKRFQKLFIPNVPPLFGSKNKDLQYSQRLREGCLHHGCQCPKQALPVYPPSQLPPNTGQLLHQSPTKILKLI